MLNTAEGQSRLALLAMKFRSTRQHAERVSIANEYRQTVEQLIRSGNWHEVPAPEDQLPNDWMPPAFFEYWSHPKAVP